MRDECEFREGCQLEGASKQRTYLNNTGRGKMRTKKQVKDNGDR